MANTPAIALVQSELDRTNASIADLQVRINQEKQVLNDLASQLRSAQSHALDLQGSITALGG